MEGYSRIVAEWCHDAATNAGEVCEVRFGTLARALVGGVMGIARAPVTFLSAAHQDGLQLDKGAVGVPLPHPPDHVHGEARRRGLRMQRPGPADETAGALRGDRPHALDGSHEGSEPAVDVVEHIGIAVRPVDRGDGLSQATAVREPDRTSLPNTAPVVRLLD